MLKDITLSRRGLLQGGAAIAGFATAPAFAQGEKRITKAQLDNVSKLLSAGSSWSPGPRSRGLRPLDFNQFPPPHPTNKDDIMPPKSDSKTTTVGGIVPYVHADFCAPGDVVVASGYLPTDFTGWLPPGSRDDSDASNGYYDPPFPPGAKLGYTLYWQNLYSQTVPGPQSITRKIKHVTGQTQTDMEKFSAEIGVKVSVLSAKISETLSHQVTISVTDETEQDYTISPVAGKTAIWTLWQLVEVYSFLDSNGSPINWSGKRRLGPGARNSGIEDWYYNCSFPSDKFPNLTQTFYPDQVLFDQ